MTGWCQRGPEAPKTRPAGWNRQGITSKGSGPPGPQGSDTGVAVPCCTWWTPVLGLAGGRGDLGSEGTLARPTQRAPCAVQGHARKPDQAAEGYSKHAFHGRPGAQRCFAGLPENSEACALCGTFRVHRVLLVAGQHTPTPRRQWPHQAFVVVVHNKTGTI